MHKSLILFFAITAISQQVWASQEITFRNVTAKIIRHNETACLDVKYDVVFTHSMGEMEALGDTSGWYVASLFFKDTGLIEASSGYKRMSDSVGKLMLDNILIPYKNSKIRTELEVKVPLAAFNIKEGVHWLHPVFLAKDQWGYKIETSFKNDSVAITIPPRIKLKLAIKEILVSDTDWHGEAWDYYVFNPKNAKPEVCWSVVLMGKKLNGSDYTNNSYTYSDPDGVDDFELSISKGDIFYIKVFDYDITSFSDLIGSLKIDMPNYKNTGIQHKTKFGLVLNMDYKLTEL